MRGNTFFGDVMHLFSANLNFKRLNIGSDNRSMQRLVKIIAGCSNPVFDASGHRLPIVMHNAQRRVTVTNFIGSYYSYSYQVIDLIKTDSLQAKFFPNRIKSLDTTFDTNKRNF